MGRISAPNVDPETGIRLGCIPCHRLSEVWRNWLADMMADGTPAGQLHRGDYVVAVYHDTLLTVLRSPFVTYAISEVPGVPNAGDLTRPAGLGQGAAAYCLGPEAFEDWEPPYSVLKACTREEVFCLKIPTLCPACRGMGKKDLAAEARERGCSRETLLRELASASVPLLAELPLANLASVEGTCQCSACGGRGLTLKFVSGSGSELLAQMGQLFYSMAPLFKVASDQLCIGARAGTASQLQADQLVEVLRVIAAAYPSLKRSPYVTPR